LQFLPLGVSAAAGDFSLDLLPGQLEDESNNPELKYEDKSSYSRKTVTIPTTAMTKKLPIVPIFLTD